jgi:thymidylate kinase
MSTVESYTQDKPFWDQHGRVGLVWSNPNASDDVLITAALLRPNFHLLLDIAVHFGLDRLKNQWRELKDSVEERQYPEEIRKVERAKAIVERCLATMEEATCAN